MCEIWTQQGMFPETLCSVVRVEPYCRDMLSTPGRCQVLLLSTNSYGETRTATTVGTASTATGTLQQSWHRNNLNRGFNTSHWDSCRVHHSSVNSVVHSAGLPAAVLQRSVKVKCCKVLPCRPGTVTLTLLYIRRILGPPLSTSTQTNGHRKPKLGVRW